MTWLTWREQRLESIIGIVIIGFLSVVLLWTGRTMVAAYEHGGSAACVASHASDDGCWSITGAFEQDFRQLDSLAPWMNFLPLFIGLLLAVPLILDFEQGTYRLAWTQSISRHRWLATKLGWMVATTIAVSLGLSLLWSWWHGPFDQLQGRFGVDSFSFEGIVPIAYALFALALCLAIGVLLRRTVPAIAITFAGFLGLRLLVEQKWRSHYLAPVKLVWDPTSPTPAAALSRLGDGDWVLSKEFALKSGATVIDPRQLLQSCNAAPKIATDGGASTNAINACLHAHGILNEIVYQPAHRFWTFQGIESAIFLGLAAALLALTVWWVLRRIA